MAIINIAQAKSWNIDQYDKTHIRASKFISLNTQCPSKRKENSSLFCKRPNIAEVFWLKVHKLWCKYRLFFSKVRSEANWQRNKRIWRTVWIYFFGIDILAKSRPPRWARQMRTEVRSINRDSFIYEFF